ncbi:MAG: 2-oxoacid:acceptor oxidoreductase subunit alpha [Anaerolineae bacterium]|nr:2-oxoacid:acceptor oxidoreductase subunit alpha [Anaerolineae bacterium]
MDIQASTQTKATANGQRIVNNFAITAATRNGTGSQTSNNVLVLSLFKMGIPVNGKNLFPSNIKGLPTWYTIRANKHGYTARPAQAEIAVALNTDTAAEDIQKLPPGGVVIIPQEWNWTKSREDIVYYEIPVDPLVKEAGINPDLRERVANMVYVGAVAQLFDISLDIIWQALLQNFNGKEKPAKINFDMAKRAYEWTAQNIVKRDPYHFEPMPDNNKGKIIITGNESAALGSLFGGVTVVAWYPITPATSLADGILEYQHIRKAADGNTVAITQAEDEISAIGAIVGAGWAGARAMTSTSGPGISLMAEFTGLAYFAEIPCVIWDVTRIGPSTGMPTRTSQGDILFIHFLSHGDTRQIVLLPSSVAECFEFGWRAFDISEQFQTPVFVASDLDLGMNNWMSEPFAYPDQPINRGKMLDKAKLEQFIADHGEWYRYRDYDGDGVGYRTVPGTDHPRAAYFTRGTSHSDKAIYSERSEDWVQNLSRIQRKINSARNLLPQPIVDQDPAKKIGILSFGSNDPAILEGRDMLAAAGIQTNYMRVRALPLADSVAEFVRTHERVYVLENNFDGQLAQIVRMEMSESTEHMASVPLGDGLPMTAQWVFEQVSKREGK